MSPRGRLLIQGMAVGRERTVANTHATSNGPTSGPGAQAVSDTGFAERVRDAIDRQELSLVFQPQADVVTNRLTGFEALSRWRLSDGTMLPPDVFVPMAEQGEAIHLLGEWTLRTACTAAAGWLRAGYPDIPVSVNLSARQLRNPRFVDNIRQRLKTFVPADGFCLELEITETVLQTAPHIVNALNELKSLGLQIAIDDFGTGYSSLNSLKHLPVDVLKIDRSFIHGIPEDADDKAIASAIIAMGHNLGMRVIAEGIETEEQLQFLIGQQCDEAQGFLVHPPLRVDECERLLAAGALVHLPVQAKTASTQGTLH